MVLRCHTLLDQNMNIVENDFLQELREDEIQNALDLLGSGCELSEFETFTSSPMPMDREAIDDNNNKCLNKDVRKSGEKWIKRSKKLERPNTIKRRYICDMCQCMMSSKDALKQHMHMKHLSEPIPCKKCDKVLSPSSLYLHEKLQHSQKFVNVSCIICKGHFKHERALQEHLRKIHNLSKTNVKVFHRICPSCGKVYTNKNSFYDHLRMKHPKSSPESLMVSCEMCGKSFGRQHLLLKHKKTHERSKETCPFCFRVFYDEDKLRSHLKEHESKKEFHCKYCPKVYTNRLSLKNHSQSNHAANRKEKKKANCILCHRVLSSEHALKGHLRRVHKIYASRNGSQDIELDKPKIVPILHQYEEVFL